MTGKSLWKYFSDRCGKVFFTYAYSRAQAVLVIRRQMKKDYPNVNDFVTTENIVWVKS